MSKRKKVLVVITKSNWGGAQRYVYDLATSLPKEKFEVSVALGGDGALSRLLTEHGIAVHHIKGLQRDISLLKEMQSFFSLLAIIRKTKPAVLHLNSSKAGALGSLAGRILFVKHIVFTTHGWAFNEDRMLIVKIIFGFFHWLTILLSHSTICVSHHLYSQMASAPFVRKKMHIVHLGIDTGSKIHTRNDARKTITDLHSALSPYAEDYWFGTVAELHPIKRLTVAIESISFLVKKHPNVRYVIIGSGEEYDRLVDAIAYHKLEQHVFLVGHIQNAASLLKAFDTFVLPSHSEGLGYVLLEAGLASLPVVASNVGGIPEIIEDNVTGLLVSPNVPELLANALDLDIDSKDARHNFGEALHQKVVSDFSLTHMVEKTAAVYGRRG